MSAVVSSGRFVTAHERREREAAQSEVDRSKGDLIEVLRNARRKRRLFGEALEARRKSFLGWVAGGVVLTACAAASAAVGDCQADLARHALEGAAACGSLALACFGLATHLATNESTDALERDVIQVGILIGRMQDLDVDNEHATGSGQRKLSGLVTEFAKLCDRHLGIDKVKFENTRRHQRYDVNRLLTLTLTGGQRTTVRVFNISRSGFAGQVDAKLSVGTAVKVGATPAKVIRTMKGGIGFEFDRVFAPADFSKDMQL